MPNYTQLERYKKLLSYLEAHFKEDIDIAKVEELCHYSYRNINRIFAALQEETIGKYVKRLRLEKAAQYLGYSEMGVTDIAYEVGFEDRAAFSKAFKSKYGYSPSEFRVGQMAQHTQIKESLLSEAGEDRQSLSFETVYLPEAQYLFLEYRGDYEDFAAIEKGWEQLIEYAITKEIISERSIFFSEIIDDLEIGDKINSRYHMALVLDKPLTFEPEGLFRTKFRKGQRYAKFTHQGSHQSCSEFYTHIYAFWMLDVGLELADLPILEYYPNAHENPDREDFITEIYIPVG